MTSDRPCVNTWRLLLAELYGDQAEACLNRVLQLVDQYALPVVEGAERGWDQRDVLLICYGDQVQAPGQPHLQSLLEFLTSQDLPRVIRWLHLLPFFPSSSDDGFAVIDYCAVDSELGSWRDVEQLGRHFTLVFDLVINHVSAASEWFQQYLRGVPPCDRYFIEADPLADVSQVVRPRSLPLLTPVETNRGLRHVWTTFSSDQVDLDYRNPDVLLAMLDILLFYLQRGARVLRLDAIAYIWKELETACVHLRQTHAIVKLIRSVVDSVAPGCLLLTETNVPHEENLSYFGDGDEAHLVYQFSLPPLLLEAFVGGDARALQDWLAGLEPTRPGTAYVNFTGSHDGIGVRPLEGLLPAERITGLIDAVRQRGGHVSTRRAADGREVPYELNITFFDALRDPANRDPTRHIRRFLASQAIMLALRGIPAIYFHCLVGTPNDSAGVAATGWARSINRRKYAAEEIAALLDDTDSVQAQVFRAYRDLLAQRILQPAFHPDADQQVWPTTDPALLAFLRTAPDRQQQILVVANMSGLLKTMPMPEWHAPSAIQDLVSGRPAPVLNRRLMLEPYQTVWLVDTTSVK
jgi:sucrose phosphorylase